VLKVIERGDHPDVNVKVSKMSPERRKKRKREGVREGRKHESMDGNSMLGSLMPAQRDWPRTFWVGPSSLHLAPGKGYGFSIFIAVVASSPSLLPSHCLLSRPSPSCDGEKFASPMAQDPIKTTVLVCAQCTLSI
jgi:hypothetical protein